jgi:UDP-glucose 4-epimerase
VHAVITGGAGFIGSHLSEKLLGAGVAVTVLDNLSTGRLSNLSSCFGRGGFQFVEGDVCDSGLLRELASGADVIFHLAAAVGVRLIVENPCLTIETNVHGTEAVLKAARLSSSRVIVASTSEVYGKNSSIPFSEGDDTISGPTTQSRWSYACSKMLDEFMALAYFQQHGTPVTVCRFFNTIGPRQVGEYGMVVPRFVEKGLAGLPLPVIGDGAQARCFCNVADTVDALYALMQSPLAVGKIVNIGNDELVTISQLADLIIQKTGSRSTKEFLSYERAYGTHFDDMRIRQPNLQLLESLVGFRPRRSLSETLDQIIASWPRG